MASNLNDANLLTWTFPDTLMNDIQGFNIYRSTGIGKTYTLLNDTLLSTSSRHWIDPKPLNDSYYRIAAIDTG